MPPNLLLSMHTPTSIQKELAADMKHLRLQVKKWKRSTLAEQSGVPESTIKRFEASGEISLRQFLMLAFTLHTLDSFHDAMKINYEGRSLDEFIQTFGGVRTRGSK